MIVAGKSLPTRTGDLFVLPLPLALVAEEGAEHAAAGWFGLPQWIWQLVNLGLFIAVLLYFVARPIATAFRNRQIEIEKRLAQAREQRAAAARFESEIGERMRRLEHEIAEIRRQGAADGESARAALERRAQEEADRVRRDSEAEIERRLAAARDELRREAAGLTSAAAAQIVAREVTDEDRRRLLSESAARLREAR